MALGIEIQMDGFAELDALWQQAPDITREVLDSVTREASEFLEGETKDLTPIGASGGGGGGLRDSIRAQEPEILANNVIGVVGTASPYAIPVELGTKPHFPPIEPLIDWVRAKLDVPERDVSQVAFQIARKISWRGTVAVGMFHRAYSMNEMQVKNKYSNATARIVERLSEAN
ncbi:MAG TPA: HK97 gp10 family phage protein [Candidatus Tenderia electrophaga]|uniref:HK97 gp10 family phage protein n=1 Tax=Candidatus Tenderia electrophaga TaxID=1748243 RepID=A0A832J404_9GAMM|nr:HK97 gp10 family phage protein [Candidatus Tenderia electrophaga]